MRTKLIFSVFVTLFGLQLAAQEDTPKNVLFIIVDDLRTALPTYGNSQVVAPNITALSRRAVQFNNSFVNIPTCGASRASILTGIRPTRDYYKNYKTRIDDDYPDAITLSELLQSNGYTTISNGKVSHHRDDKEETWDEVWRPNSVSTKDYLLPENIAANKLPHENNHPPVEKAAVSDDMYKDGKIANKTIADLKKLKQSGKPFFLATGFLKPHLPFNAPTKYWEYYNRDDIKLPLNNKFPEKTFEQAGRWYELVKYKGIRAEGETGQRLSAVNFTMDTAMAKELIHGYYACVSYVDAQIGKVLQALDDLGLSEDTMVIFTSDHGFSLMEHNRWSKHNLFKVENHVPLMIRVPGLSAVGASNSFVEHIDLYPTICDVLGIEKPQQLEGRSLVENLTNPTLITKSNAYSRYTNGDLYVSDKYFYSEWKYRENGNIIGRMLFDIEEDPLQMKNLSHLEAFKAVMDSLSNNLKQKTIF